MNIEELNKISDNITTLIGDYLSGDITRDDFANNYPSLLEAFEEETGEGAYHPLDILVPTEDNSESAWKEDMIAMYHQQIEELESTLEDNEPSYSETMTDEQLKENCELALKSIQQEVTNRVMECWLEDNVVDDVFFKFHTEDGGSIFGHSKVIYKTELVKESFLLSMFSGKLEAPKFSLESLIHSIKDTTKGQSCNWVNCSEPDGAIASIEFKTPVDYEPYDHLDCVQWIEKIHGDETQWGDCHLILMSTAYDWMLKLSNNFKEFSIELHGNNEFLSETLNKVGL